MTKWNLITGGSKRLGGAVALELAKEGRSVVIQFHKDQEEAKLKIEELKEHKVDAAALFGDFSTVEGVEDFIRRYKKSYPETESLVNNVGPWQRSPLLEAKIQEAKELFQIQFFAPFRLMQELSPSLIKSRGAIVNIGISGLNSSKGHPSTLFYFTAKQALFEATKAFAKELDPHLVRVNMVSPGFLEHSVEDPFKSIVPTKEAEAAKWIAYLLSDDNKTLTGKNIEIDGGLTL